MFNIAQYVDILMSSETKLDSTFPLTQFLINGFSVPHRLDRNSKGGGILLYIKDKIGLLPLNRYSLSAHIEILFFGLNLRNRKWLLYCFYKPHKNLMKEHLRVLTEGIQFYSKEYENILLMGDYKAEITETNMSSFCETYHLTDIIKQLLVLKILQICHADIFLTNNANYFQKSQFLKPVFLNSIRLLLP